MNNFKMNNRMQKEIQIKMNHCIFIFWVSATGCMFNLFLSFFLSWVANTQLNHWTNPLHCYEFGLPKFFSKTFKFSIIFYSTWQGQCRKACRSREKVSKQSEITWKQSEPVKSISKIERRKEFVRALWYEQCPKNSFKRLYILKGLLVLVGKASFSKEFWSEFHIGGGGKRILHIWLIT